MDALPRKLRLQPVLGKESQLIRARYQKGSLARSRRADGKTWWILRYRITDPTGKRVQRHRDVGTTEEFKSESQAQKAADAIRLQINNDSPTMQLTTVGVLARHFKQLELRDDDDRRAWSTKRNYKDMINGWILPRWESTRLMHVKSVAIEEWLSMVKHKETGKPLANPTEQRIRNIFSV